MSAECSIGERLGGALGGYLLTQGSISAQLMGWCCVRPIEDLRTPATRNPRPGRQVSQTSSPIRFSTELRSAGAKPLPTYIPPRPEKTVRPNLAAFNRSQLAGLRRITIEVYIDDSGHVLAARLLDLDGDVSNRVMAALLSAARQWVFNPAQNGGRTVPARRAIVFRFAGS